MDLADGVSVVGGRERNQERLPVGNMQQDRAVCQSELPDSGADAAG